MPRKAQEILLAISLLIFALYPLTQKVFAAEGTIGFSPSGFAYTPGTPFSVDLVIDAGTDRFNAAQATASVSAMAQISNLILGDCNFAFIKTPTAADLSFAGVILGGSATKCSAYTVVLNPTRDTTTITLSNASLKRYPDSNEILTFLQNGFYTKKVSIANTINVSQEQIRNPPGNEPSPTIIPTANPILSPTLNQLSFTPSSPSSYTVAVNVLTEQSKPIVGATAIIDPPQYSLPNQSITAKATTDKNGLAQFIGISAGIHILKIVL